MTEFHSGSATALSLLHFGFKARWKCFKRRVFKQPVIQQPDFVLLCSSILDLYIYFYFLCRVGAVFFPLSFPSHPAFLSPTKTFIIKHDSHTTTSEYD